MSDRAMQGLRPPPTSPSEVQQAVTQIADRQAVVIDNPAEFDAQMARTFPGGFSQRDEANALIALAVRNGPLENLHAGKESELLHDDTLSRLTDAEMRAMMIFASRTLAVMLQLRDEAPDVYRRHLQRVASTYCRSWERADKAAEL